jgi:hypothetical protein
MMQGALTIVPTLITIVSSAKNALGGMEGAQKLLNQAMTANPIFLVITAIAALIAILVTAYYTIQPFRDAVDSLGRFLGLLPPVMSDAEKEAERLAKVMAFGAEQTRMANERYEETVRTQDNFRNSVLDLGREVEGTNEVLSRNCSTLEDFRGLESDASAAVERLEECVKNANAEMEKQNAILETQKRNFGEGSAAVSLMGRDTDRLTTSEREHGGQIEELNRQIIENTALTEQQVKEIQDQIVELEAAAVRAEQMADYILELGESYNVMQAKASPALADVAYQWKAYVDSGNIEEAARLAEEWGAGFGLVVGKAGEVLSGFIDTQDKATMAARAFRDSLEEDYAVLVLKSSSTFAQMATFYQEAFSAGKIDQVEDFVNRVAAAMGLDPGQVASILASYKKPLDEVEDAVETTTTVVESALSKFTRKVSDEWEVQRASADTNLEAVAKAFSDAYSSGRIDAAIAVIQGFAEYYGLSFEEAEGVIVRFTDAQKREFDKQSADQVKAAEAAEKALSAIQDSFRSSMDKIKGDYFDRFTVESEPFMADIDRLAQFVVSAWNQAGGATELQTVSMNNSMMRLADEWGLSWEEIHGFVIKAADGITAEMERIPESIEDQLIGKAQADFQAFTDCVTGKSRTLNTDVTGQIDNLAGNITDLINKGLVGEAQAEMQAYVDCNTNKTATMVEDINGLMEKLTADHNAQIENMRATAETLTGAEKASVLRQIDELTTQYTAKMQQLRDWQNQILEQMVSDADRAVAAAQDRAAFAAASPPPSARRFLLPEDLEASLGVSDQVAQALGSAAVAPALDAGETLLKAIGGPEKPTVSIQINAPLVNIEGSADRATADLAASMVQESLKNVVIEPSSSGAPATSKQIRIGNKVTVAV